MAQHPMAARNGRNAILISIGPVAVGFNSADTLLAGLIGDNDLHTNIVRQHRCRLDLGRCGRRQQR